MQLQSYPCLMSATADHGDAIIPVQMIAESYPYAVQSAETITGAGQPWGGFTPIVLDTPIPWCGHCQRREDHCDCPGFTETP